MTPCAVTTSTWGRPPGIAARLPFTVTRRFSAVPVLIQSLRRLKRIAWPCESSLPSKRISPVELFLRTAIRNTGPPTALRTSDGFAGRVDGVFCVFGFCSCRVVFDETPTMFWLPEPDYQAAITRAVATAIRPSASSRTFRCTRRLRFGRTWLRRFGGLVAAFAFAFVLRTRKVRGEPENEDAETGQRFAHPKILLDFRRFR